MMQINGGGLWETSLLGRLLMFVLVLWDESWIGRAVAALGRFSARVFNGSLFGRLLYSDWPSSLMARESVVGRLVAWLGRVVTAFGRWSAGFFRGTWESSLLGRLARGIFRALLPAFGSSLLVSAFTGYAADVVPAAGERGEQRTSPVLYVLGLVLGLVPVLPSSGGGIFSPTLLTVAGIWLVAVLWVVVKFMQDDYEWRGSSAMLPLLLLLVVAAVSTVQSASRRDSLLQFIIWVSAVLLFWVTVNLVRTTRDAAVLLGPVFVGGALMGLWAGYQYFISHPVVLEAWSDPTTFGTLVRAFAGMGNPNYLGEYMTLFLPLGVALWFQVRPKRRLELGALLALMAFALLVTWSRGAWLALIIALAIFVFMRARRWSIFMVLGGLAGLVVAPSSVLARLTSAFSTQDSSNAFRVNIWIGVEHMLQKWWFIGAGLGAPAFEKVYSEYMLAAARAAHTHNLYRELFAEMGILGLICVRWSGVALFRRPGVRGLKAPRS
ncbi:MAG: O-antigen ligase family protein, partial [Mycobacterium leprae]